MRKLILISALLLASASAYAGPSTDLTVAANDTPAATTDTTRPLPPVNQPDAAKPAAQTPKPQLAATGKPHASRRPVVQGHSYASDEAKARRIAARYGISW